jgi:hypothetical protein
MTLAAVSLGQVSYRAQCAGNHVDNRHERKDTVATTSHTPRTPPPSLRGSGRAVARGLCFSAPPSLAFWAVVIALVAH